MMDDMGKVRKRAGDYRKEDAGITKNVKPENYCEGGPKEASSLPVVPSQILK